MTDTPATFIPVSLVMIVAECDADQFSGAIMSASMLVSEVIVVADPGSQHVIAAAKRMGATVVEFAWCDDFAAARNAGLEACTGEWVIVLDADETLEVSDRAALRVMLISAPAIYTITVSSIQDNDSIVTNDTPRLFPLSEAIRYVGAIHETPWDSRKDPIPHLHMPLIAISHTGYTSEGLERGRKAERNIEILSSMIDKNPINPQFRLYMAQALIAVSPAAAADQLRLAMHFCKIHRGVNEVVSTYDQAAADFMHIMGTWELFGLGVIESKTICEWREPEHAGFWVNLSNCQVNVGDFNGAASSAFKAIAHRDKKVQQQDRSAITWLPEAQIGIALANMKREKEAMLFLERALELKPTPEYAERIALARSRMFAGA